MAWYVDNVHIYEAAGGDDPVALPFTEDWESGDFSTNGWSFENAPGNWEVWDVMGNPGNSARFAGFPDQFGYDFALVSPVLNAGDATNVTLDFDFIARLATQYYTEYFDLEVRTTGGDWIELVSYNYDTPGAFDDWDAQTFDLTPYVLGADFQICFRAHGNDTFDLMAWYVDNVHIYEAAAPQFASIYGHILSENDQSPITNATVVLDTLGCVSFCEGGEGTELYGYCWSMLDPGTYNIMVSAEGYENYSETIELSGDMELHHDIFMSKIIDNPNPENLNGQIVGIDSVELTWDACEDYAGQELAYDNGTDEMRLDFQSPTNMMILANAFVMPENGHVDRLSYYIDPQLSMSYLSHRAEFFIIGESNGLPDYTNVLSDRVIINEFSDDLVIDAFWLNIPAEVELNAGELFYVCVMWYQEDSEADYFTLGADVDSGVDENSWMTIDGENWMPMTGQYGVDFMIRCEVIPQTQRDLIGYNVYRDLELINDVIVSETVFIDSDIPQGTYSYTVTACYDDEESGQSQAVDIEVGYLPVPESFDFQLLYDDDLNHYAVEFSWYVDNNLFDLEGYNVYRDGIQLNTTLLPTYPTNISDITIENTQTYNYTIEAVYAEGVSEMSIGDSITVLLPPEVFIAQPGDSQILFSWDTPYIPAESDFTITGYNLYKDGEQVNTPLITENDYLLDIEEPSQFSDYYIETQYDYGLSIGSYILNLNVELDILASPASFSCSGDTLEADLQWEHPAATGLLLKSDNDQKQAAFGYENLDSFIAMTQFSYDYFAEQENMAIDKIAFMPAVDADYVVQLWFANIENPDCYNILSQTEVLDVVVDQWNVVDIEDFNPQQQQCNLRLAVKCSNYSDMPLYYDNGPSVGNADLINLNGSITDLGEEQIDANWMIRGLMINTENHLTEVEGYNIYRDDELVTTLSAADISYCDSNLTAGDYQYKISTKYNFLGIIGLESIYSETIAITVLDRLMAPENLSVDSALGRITWENPTESTLRELTGYNVYLDNVFIDTITDTMYQYNNLINGENYLASVEAVYSSGVSVPAEIDFQYDGTSTDDIPEFVTKLNGNYPNPFNPQTEIRFSIAQTDDVEIQIFNIKGQHVKTLCNNEFAAGNHSLTWFGDNENGNAVASGVYFYTFKTGEYTSTAKMILMK